MKKIIVFLLIFLSCKNSKGKDEIIIDENFKEILIKYSEKFPIPKFENKIEGLIYPVPSYQVFFKKLKNDTIISIKLSPFLVGLNPLDFEINRENDSISYKFQEPVGRFLFRNKSVIIYDEDNYADKILKKDKLIIRIPDSLKGDLNKVNTHVRSRSEYYKLTKSSLLKIDL